MTTNIFSEQLDLVFLVYGLAFVIMGVAILVQPRRESKFSLSTILWLLAAFGITHGINEWIDMFAIIKKSSPGYWEETGRIILFLSYAFFFEFGRRLFFLDGRKPSFMEKVRLPLFYYLSVLGMIFLLPQEDPGILIRYFLGFPAGMLTAAGFIRYYTKNKDELSPLGVGNYFLIAACAFGAYGVLGGLVTPPGNLFLSRTLNNTYFIRVGIPVQVFRAFCAIAAACAVWKILGIFNWEIREELTHMLEQKLRELKVTQNTLMQAEKMEIVGKLASGVAHEVKNPLATIQMGVEYLKKHINSDDTRVPEFLSDIEAAVSRADTIIKGLLDFSAISSLDMKPESINAVIDNVLVLLKHLYEKNHIIVSKDFDTRLPDVAMDKNHMEQVMVNLILNAIQAMPEGGTLLIRTFLRVEADKQRWALVQIEDTGTGIAQDELKNIFEPFFTTKRSIGGTGLGLSIVKNIIEMHEGKISIDNRQGLRGVIVTVSLRV
jgi:signal transduction histidine kinase